MASALLLSSCALPPEAGHETNAEQYGQTAEQALEESEYMDTTENVIYLAGGCFWGIESLMQSIPGVIDAQSGYANGTGEEDANYPTVSTGRTGFRE